MPEPHLRAADADRAAVAEVLGRHLSAGRLTVDEYDERLGRAYAARTYGELDQLTADLPEVPPARPAAPAAPPPATVGTWGHGAGPWNPWGGSGLQAAWASWATTAAIVVSIWVVSMLATGWVHPWPIWVIGPWGAVLLVQSLPFGKDGGDRGRQLGGGPRTGLPQVPHLHGGTGLPGAVRPRRTCTTAHPADPAPH